MFYISIWKWPGKVVTFSSFQAYDNFISNMSYQWYFFGSLVSNTFSNSKLNIFIITGFVCSNKYVKQLVLINHSCMAPK